MCCMKAEQGGPKQGRAVQSRAGEGRITKAIAGQGKAGECKRKGTVRASQAWAGQQKPGQGITELNEGRAFGHDMTPAHLPW